MENKSKKFQTQTTLNPWKKCAEFARWARRVPLNRPRIPLKFFLLYLCFISAAIFSPQAEAAANGAWAKARSGAGQVRLISEWSSLDPSIREIKMGLQFKLEKGWHTFAENPGTTIGYPPKIHWTLNQKNWSASKLLLPQSKSIKIKNPFKPEEDMELAGYEDEVIYLVALSGQSLTGSEFSAEVDLNYLVCDVQCVPETAKLRLNIPIQNKFKASSEAKLINRAFDELPPQNTSDSSASVESSSSQNDLEISFIFALILAFLGGALLNLMPCVLPVIGIKTFQLIKLEKTEQKKIRSSLLWTILGIILSFEFLAALLLAFRYFGYQVGWGFQFQSPSFLIFMIVVLVIFAFNLFGAFEFKNLPSGFLNSAAKMRGPFWEGAFAALLATPCTAPFLGTALGYSLTLPAASTLLLFLVMGLGLSLPYLFLWISPGTLKILPKPGRWMDITKRILGLLLLASSIWLGIVLSHILDSKTSENFSEASLIERIEKNSENLFIDITADWCLTCKYNEVSVINTDWFKAELEKRKISLLMIDWTQPNENISKFLEKNGRRGIPFSMLWSKDRRLVLPELLTRANVTAALDEFSSNE